MAAVLALALVLQSGAEAVADEKALPYRIVSFHRGQANKETIRRAAELGFNGVMIQLEHGNVKPLMEFAERDKREGYVALCHSLGMKITLWVHELSDISTDPQSPEYLGPTDVDNEKLWSHLEERYEWVLGELLPEIDGLVLTVVETQIWATDSALMKRIVETLQGKCDKYGKDLIVRTFVHHPEEFRSVMECVNQLPPETLIMSKNVPQDWHVRGVYNPPIGNVGGKDQIVEYDIAGEYFLMDAVANCMPEMLKRHFDYGVSRGVDGICVRVDRERAEVLHHPHELNLWALGMWATGKADSVDEVWEAWARARYGEKAAAGVIAALKPTERVMAEVLCGGDFTFSNARDFLVYHNDPNGDGDAWDMPWNPARWNEAYQEEYKQAIAGDPRFLRRLEVDKRVAARLAQRSLDELEKVKGDLHPSDYEILKTKLTTNKIQLEYRAPMMLAYTRYRRILNTGDQAEKVRLAAAIRKDLSTVRSVANREYPPMREIEHMGRKWRVGSPEFVNWDRTRAWADRLEELLHGQGL